MQFAKVLQPIAAVRSNCDDAVDFRSNTWNEGLGWWRSWDEASSTGLTPFLYIVSTMKVCFRAKLCLALCATLLSACTIALGVGGGVVGHYRQPSLRAQINDAPARERTTKSEPWPVLAHVATGAGIGLILDIAIIIFAPSLPEGCIADPSCD